MIKTIYFILFFFLINCNRSNRSSIDINGHVFIKFDSKTHISKYEVSNSQFAKYLNSAFKEGKIRVDSMSRFLSYYGGDRYYKKGEKEIIQIIDNEASIVYHKDSGFKVLDGKDNLPVINITWFGAYNYCQYYGLKLPSENQWLEITKNIIEVDSFYTIKNSFLAVFGSLIIVFLYILIRFKNWQFSLGAVSAVFHDVLVVLGIFSLTYKIMPFNMEINQAFIAALLTVIGYSLNDTVVVFDRIREYISIKTGDRMDVINRALNSTLSRTINTSLTTFFVLLVILYIKI